MSSIAVKPAATENDQECFPIHPIPDIPRFSDVLALYDKKITGGSAPYFTSIDLLEFGQFLPSMALSRREGSDYRFEYFGTDFLELFAQDFTGSLLCECVDPATMDATCAYFMELCSGPFIGRTTGRVPAIGRDYLQFDVLDMPLLGEQNEVSHFLHAVVREAGL